jgi:hypothetical protein
MKLSVMKKSAKVMRINTRERPSALQRTNAENSKQIFPEQELRGHSPNFHIHVSVSDLYISMTDLPVFLQEIPVPILGIYKSITDTWMWKLGQAIPRKGIHKWDFLCSVPISHQISKVLSCLQFGMCG